jgi:hypothetical protein
MEDVAARHGHDRFTSVRDVRELRGFEWQQLGLDEQDLHASSTLGVFRNGHDDGSGIDDDECGLNGNDRADGNDPDAYGSYQSGTNPGPKNPANWQLDQSDIHHHERELVHRLGLPVLAGTLERSRLPGLRGTDWVQSFRCWRCNQRGVE